MLGILVTASLVGIVSRRRQQRRDQVPPGNPTEDALDRVVVEEYLLIDERGNLFIPHLTLNRDNVEFVFPEVPFDQLLRKTDLANNFRSEKLFCSICLDEINYQTIVRRLFCGHTFHSSCILKWILVGRSKSCPLCQKSFAVKKSTVSVHCSRAANQTDWNYLFFFI